MNECPECGYSDGHTKQCPVYRAARARGEHAQLSQQALRESQGQDLLLGGAVLAVVVAVVVLLVVFAGGSHHKTPTAKAKPSSPSPAFMLASLDRGLDPSADAVALWQQRLDILSEHCSNSQTDLADIVTTMRQELRDAGYQPSYAETANGLIDAARRVPSSSRTDCAQLAAAAVTIVKAGSGG